MKKLLLTLLLLCPSLLQAQTSITGRVMVGSAATRPTVCAATDLYATTDTFALFECGPANTWTQYVTSPVPVSSLATTGTWPFAGTISGNWIKSGTETSTGPTIQQNYLNFGGGTCTVENLQAAITAVVSGVVDFRGCTTISDNITNTTGSVVIPKNVHVFLGSSTWTCTITTASTPCWWLQGDNSELIGMGMGDPVTFDSGGDPTNAAASGVTNLICSSCGTTTDMVYVAIPSASRTGVAAAIISGVEVADLWFNMGNSGRHVVYTDSPHFSRFHHFVGFNFPGDGFLLENDISGTTNNVGAYQNDVYAIMMQPPHSNTTGTACHLAAVNGGGDITWNHFRNLRCSGNITNGGGKTALWIQAVTSNAHQNSFQSSYFGETILGQGNTYGIKLEASGSWNASVNPYIADDTFHSILIEKLFGDNQGICFGGFNGSVASGVGVGGISLVGVSCSANWASPGAGSTGNIDSGHLGFHTEISGSTVRSSSASSMQSAGATYGNNSSGLLMSHTATGTANSDTLYGLRILPNFTTGVAASNNTGIKAVGGLFDCSNDATFTVVGAGSFASNWCLQIEAAQTPATSSSGGILIDNFGFGDSIRLTNGGPLAWVESSAPAVGAIATHDRCYGDSTLHGLKCSYNGGAFSGVPLLGIANTALAAMTWDMSAVTVANAFKVPVIAGGTAGANGVVVYDSTNNNTHIRTNAADSLAVAEAAALAANTIPKATDATHSLLTASSCTDNGTVFSCTEGISPPQAAGIIGTTTNNNANAGSVGEYVTATIATGSSVTLTTATTANVTSMSLTAGDWDVWGTVDYTAGATTSITNQRQGISTTSATLGAQDTFSSDSTAAQVPTGAIDDAFPTPLVRLSLSGTTTVFLVSNATFTVSSLKAYGTISARRVR